jgi:hypothetical protein
VGSPIFDPGCEKTIAILNDVNGYNKGQEETIRISWYY